MDEIFGRVTAILFAAAVFMGMPLVYMSERAKSAEQMYLLTVNTEFVDSICNTGFLTMEMYQQFYKEISAASGIYEVHMYREQKDIVLEQGDYSYESIFFDEKDIVAFTTLGIGRLIYQLPIPLCKMFIKEIFDGKSPDDFDEETLTTINKFFENSLNVSETSRQLYIHRNTLVYRLDKLQKYTGLDLRVFEDAITFKIALMVVKYMKYMESLDY